MSKKIIIVDIDGTISKVGDRIKYLEQDPKDWDAFYAACGEDDPKWDIIYLVTGLISQGFEIVFCTGRRESVRNITQVWLNHKFLRHFHADELLMRHDGDFRHDTIVKPELLIEAGISTDRIFMVLEDRNSMVAKWREMGLTCLQVADGDF